MLSQTIYQFAYWHALNKMQAGLFDQAQTLLGALMASRPNTQVQLAIAYCQARQFQYDKARQSLRALAKTDLTATQQRAVAQLLRRCYQKNIHA